MSEWQQYKFVDKTGKCFQAFADIEDDTSYHRHVAGLLMASDNDDDCTFEVGDMCVFRDELKEAGFVWGKDFYVKKVGQGR